jgi:type II secretory pathway component PulM
MRRILLVMAAAALMAVMMVAMVAPAFARANHETGSGSGAGQTRAQDQCFNTILNQDAGGPSKNQGHPNSGPGPNAAPTNCQHFFQL